MTETEPEKENIGHLGPARGLDTEGHLVDPPVCLDCFQTRPDQVRSAIERDQRMEAEFAAAQTEREPQ